jgi:hypothetical protein
MEWMTLFGILMGFFLAAGFIYKTYAWKQVSKSDNEEAEREDIKDAQADLDAEKEYLHGLTVKELTALAREQNLKGYSKLKKADLIAALIKQG